MHGLCKGCKNRREIDEDGYCWVCNIKHIDKIMEEKEQKEKPKPFLFNP